MAECIYLAATEAASGKSAVALALLEHLGRGGARVLPFRPLVPAVGEDELLEVLIPQLGPGAPDLADLCGVAYEDLHEDPDHSMEVIVDRYHRVADHCDVVLVIGSDFSGIVTPTEFGVNASIAANLAGRMVLVFPVAERTPNEVAATIRVALQAAAERHATVAGVIVNQVEPDALDRFTAAFTERVPTVPVVALPNVPLLRAPTMLAVAEACDGQMTHGNPDLLDRECMGIVVAAMTLPHVLDRMKEDHVLIIPADREEVLLGALLAHRSLTFPTLTGIILNGGFPLSPQIDRLIAGLDVDLPIVACPTGTMQTARMVERAKGRITTETPRKIEAAIQVLGDRLAGSDLLAALDLPTRPGVVTPLMFEHQVVEDARRSDALIVLPEGAEPRILEAARQVRERQIARLTLLGDRDAIEHANQRVGLDLDDVTIIDPFDEAYRQRFAEEYAQIRSHKGVTVEQARDIVTDPSYFGTLLVHDGLVDGMVSGSITTTAATVRPALEIVKTAPGVSVVSSVFLMALADQVLVYGDCAINPDPNADQLADIAISSAQTARQFGIDPRVAMLSYSTGGSGTGADVEKVRAATELVRERAPELLIEGPIQYDAAVDPKVAATKLKGSPVAGQATVLIFPDLNTGNNTYKAVQRSAGAIAIGPVLQGLGKPVNDLSRGALVRDIVNTIAITAVQAANR
ncbi:phosphate acetyltransferase [Janibacter sp. GXQ6167]|uniref:phosphate acetyltransferase n=1 Tax=Janibacter sp. GXQ6167 TaxID=3240791 RepID=UPI003523B909